MKYCPNCGKAGIEGMKFCPQCGQKLIGSSLEAKQTRVPKPEVPLKERNWFERHLNWTMFFGLLGSYLIIFVAAYLIALYDPYAYYVSDAESYVISLLILLAILIPVWGWALRRKNRSLWWLPLGLFVPFGFIVLLCLENRSQISKLRELQG